MSVTPFIPHRAFDPEAIEVMSSTLATVCADLGVSDRAGRMTELLAKHVIEAAQKGIREENRIRGFVIRQFKSNPQ